MPKNSISPHYLVFLVLLGMAGGGLLTLEPVRLVQGFLSQKKVPPQELSPVLNSESRLYSKKTNLCRAVCTTPPEKEKVIAVRKPTTNTVRGGTRLSDIPKNPKNPNAIRISLREAPTILAEVKMVNGRPTCAKKNDKGRKSKKYNHVHIDRECCLDPDEIPNPRCLYR